MSTARWIIADSITTEIKRIGIEPILVLVESRYPGTLTRSSIINLTPKDDRVFFLRKNSLNHFLRATFFTVIMASMIVAAWTGEAEAYLDPGTGSQLLQLLLAGLLGALFTIKMYWQKLKIFFKNLMTKKSESDNN